jgi:hypothetical protein
MTPDWVTPLAYATLAVNVAAIAFAVWMFVRVCRQHKKWEASEKKFIEEARRRRQELFGDDKP